MDKKLIVLDLDGTTLKKRRNHLLAYEKMLCKQHAIKVTKS